MTEELTISEVSVEQYIKSLPANKSLKITDLHRLRFNRRYLDDEEVFDLWIKLGDTGKVYEHYVKTGFVSPFTGKPPVEGALIMAAFRYLTTNFKDAMVKLKVAYENAHEPFDEEEIIKSLLYKIGSYTSRSYLLKWIVVEKLYEKYFDYIPKKYGLGQHQLESMIRSEGNFDLYRYYEGILPQRTIRKIARLRII